MSAILHQPLASLRWANLALQRASSATATAAGSSGSTMASSSGQPVQAAVAVVSEQQHHNESPERDTSSHSPFRLLLLGDTMLGRLVGEVLHNEPPEYPWGNTLPAVLDSECRVLNLETALSSHPTPWTRTPKVFHFKGHPHVVSTLTCAGIHGVSVANNHILDYNEEGMFETMATLDRAGIARAGAGRSIGEAEAPAIFDVPVHVPGIKAVQQAVQQKPGQGTRAGDQPAQLQPGVVPGQQQRHHNAAIRVALLACTDNEPAWLAGPSRPGVNHLVPDPSDTGAAMQWVRRGVQQARDAGANMIILSNHWGGNWVLRPPPSYRAFANECVQAGVDVYFGHSPHVTQGIQVVRRHESQTEVAQEASIDVGAGGGGAIFGAGGNPFQAAQVPPWARLLPATASSSLSPGQLTTQQQHHQHMSPPQLCPVLYACGDWIDDYAVDREWRNDWSMAFKLHFGISATDEESWTSSSSSGQPGHQQLLTSSKTRLPLLPRDTTHVRLRALELIPVKLSFAHTNLSKPGDPDHKPMCDRMQRLCSELRTHVKLEADGHLWARF